MGLFGCLLDAHHACNRLGDRGNSGLGAAGNSLANSLNFRSLTKAPVVLPFCPLLVAKPTVASVAKPIACMVGIKKAPKQTQQSTTLTMEASMHLLCKLSTGSGSFHWSNVTVSGARQILTITLIVAFILRLIFLLRLLLCCSLHFLCHLLWFLLFHPPN